MKNAVVSLAVVAGLSACAPAVPDSGQGVGFSNYEEYQQLRAQREAQLAGSGSTSFDAPAPITTGAITTEDLAAVGIGEPQQPDAVETATTAVLETAPAVEFGNNPSISDEQEFSAVSSRESIESDAERRAAQAAAREEIAPTALPTRSSGTGPNIVAYALNAPNNLGQEWYSRSLLSGEARFQRNCASYNTPDDAQRDFLSRGGPERDPRGIDPDGDGFACGWDPAPFRLAAGN